MKPVFIYKWVSDNNPPDRSKWKSGWWHYVEFGYRLMDYFSIEKPEVVGTYRLKTPPPEEKLLMPVFRFKMKTATVTLQHDFGAFSETWAVSVKAQKPVHSPMKLFDPAVDIRKVPTRGPRKEWFYGPYQKNRTRFSCGLKSDWDVVILMKVI